jgi:hypothetical protein
VLNVEIRLLVVSVVPYVPKQVVSLRPSELVGDWCLLLGDRG